MGPAKKEENNSRVLMLIGTYAGKYIDELPSYYLKWIAENWDEDSAFKKKYVIAADKEWQWREDNNCHITKEDFEGGRVQ